MIDYKLDTMKMRRFSHLRPGDEFSFYRQTSVYTYKGGGRYEDEAGELVGRMPYRRDMDIILLKTKMPVPLDSLRTYVKPNGVMSERIKQ